MFVMEKNNNKKTKSVLLYIGGVGMVLCAAAVILRPQSVIPAGVLAVVFVILQIKGFCDFVSGKLEEIVGKKLDNLSADTSLQELADINKATYMRIKKIDEEVGEVLDRSGMSRAEMEECNRHLSDEIAKRQMCIANIQIKRNAENTDALLNSNDKILGQFGQVTRIVQKSALEAEISRKEEPVYEAEEIMPEPVPEPLPEVMPEAVQEVIPEDSIEILDDMEDVEEIEEIETIEDTEKTEDPNRQLTAEEIAAMFENM